MKQGDQLILFGDYNLPKLQWVKDDDECDFLFAINASSASEIVINDGMLMNGLNQVNPFNNSNDVKLDLVFTNHSDKLTINETEPLVKNESHHNAIKIMLQNFSGQQQHSSRKVQRLYFKKVDILNVIAELEKVNWQVLLAFSKSLMRSGLFINDEMVGVKC